MNFHWKTPAEYTEAMEYDIKKKADIWLQLLLDNT